MLAWSMYAAPSRCRRSFLSLSLLSLFLSPSNAQAFTRVCGLDPGRFPLLASCRINTGPFDEVPQSKSLTSLVEYAQCFPIFLAVVFAFVAITIAAAAATARFWLCVSGPLVGCISGGYALSFRKSHHAAIARRVTTKLVAEAIVSKNCGVSSLGVVRWSSGKLLRDHRRPSY